MICIFHYFLYNSSLFQAQAVTLTVAQAFKVALDLWEDAQEGEFIELHMWHHGSSMKYIFSWSDICNQLNLSGNSFKKSFTKWSSQNPHCAINTMGILLCFIACLQTEARRQRPAALVLQITVRQKQQKHSVFQQVTSANHKRDTCMYVNFITNVRVEQPFWWWWIFSTSVTHLKWFQPLKY